MPSGFSARATHNILILTMAKTPVTLFPSIGSVADQADKLESREIDQSTDNTTSTTLSTNDNQEKVVQEVESLCMKCGEQVSLDSFVGALCVF